MSRSYGEFCFALNELLLDWINDLVRVEKFAVEEMFNKDCTITEVHALEVVPELEHITMSEMANRIGVTDGTMTVTVNRLVEKGYVERLRCNKDRRVVKIKLTEKGKILSETYQRFHDEMIEKITGELSEKERDSLLEILTRLTGYFENYKRHIGYVNERSGERK